MRNMQFPNPQTLHWGLCSSLLCHRISFDMQSTQRLLQKLTLSWDLRWNFFPEVPQLSKAESLSCSLTPFTAASAVRVTYWEILRWKTLEWMENLFLSLGGKILLLLPHSIFSFSLPLPFPLLPCHSPFSPVFLFLSPPFLFHFLFFQLSLFSPSLTYSTHRQMSERMKREAMSIFSEICTNTL